MDKKINLDEIKIIDSNDKNNTYDFILQYKDIVEEVRSYAPCYHTAIIRAKNKFIDKFLKDI